MGHCRKDICTIVLTNKCNLNCSYCWVSKTPHDFPKKVIDLEFAKRGILDYYKQTGSNYIGFFASGEPTLELDMMKEIVEYTKDLIGDIKVELQTNGVFNENVFKWISKNVNILWVSADGPIEINDLNRKARNGIGSGIVIEKNIKKLIEYINTTDSKLLVGIRSTIGNFNVFKQKELIDYYYNLGIRAIYVDQICAEVSEEGTENKFLTGQVDSLTFAKEFYEAYEYAKNKGVFYGTIATMNFDEEVNVSCRSLIPMPHLTPDGIVSSCEMCYEEGSPLDVFIYGKWNKEKKLIDYDEEKINKIKSRTIDNLYECKECKFIKHCAGSCAGETVNETGSLYKKNDRLCSIVKYLGERIELNTGVYPHLHP